MCEVMWKSGLGKRRINGNAEEVQGVEWECGDV